MSTAPLPIAVVTGANTGIGYAAALRLLRPQLVSADVERKFGCVVLACRNVASARAAASRMVATAPSTDAPVTPPVVVVHLDLASLSSVRGFRKRLREAVGGSLFDAAGVGLLVCNAGKGWGTRTKNKIMTEDGFESFLQVNYLSHFLLSINLLPDLVRGANSCGQASRVVHVSSSLHDPASRGNRKTSVRLDLESLARLDQGGEPIAPCSQPLLGGEEKDGGGGAAGSSTFNPKQAYCRSKLMQVMFSYELQQRLRAHDLPVTSSCLNPGFIPSSGLIRDSSWLGIFFLRYCLDGAFKLCCSVTRSLDDGGTCVYLVATQPEAADGGLYFEYTRGGVLRAHSSSEESYDTAKQQALWDTSCRLCGLSPDGGLAGAGGVGRAE